MTKAEEMIRRAREAQEQKEGVRMKARLPDRMWGRVKRCADAACMAAEEWVCLACRAWLAGRFDGVAYDSKELLGTREGSRAQWVRVPHWFDMESLRPALAAGVAWHEPRIRPVTPQKGCERWVEGKDYVVREEK